MRIVNFAIFTLIDYWRSRGIITELVVACVTFWLFLNGGRGEVELRYVFFVLGLFSVLIAGLTTFRILQRETNERAYIPLSKPLKRSGFLLGKMLAALLVVVCLDGALLAASLLRNGIPLWDNASHIALGMLFILPCAIGTIAIFTLLSPLVTSPAYLLLAIIMVLCGLFNKNVDRTFERISKAIAVRINFVGSVITWVTPPLGKNIELSMKYTDRNPKTPKRTVKAALLWGYNAVYGLVFLVLSLKVFKGKELTFM